MLEAIRHELLTLAEKLSNKTGGARPAGHEADCTTGQRMFVSKISGDISQEIARAKEQWKSLRMRDELDAEVHRAMCAC